jgi:hypothetical protein
MPRSYTSKVEEYSGGLAHIETNRMLENEEFSKTGGLDMPFAIAPGHSTTEELIINH